MFLEGDMLDSMSRVRDEERRNTVKIAIGESEVPKAYNHQKGDTLPKRTFFGLTDSEARDIARELRPASSSTSLTALRNALSVLGIEQDG